jgi:hypothetical protein
MQQIFVFPLDINDFSSSESSLLELISLLSKQELAHSTR